MGEQLRLNCKVCLEHGIEKNITHHSLNRHFKSENNKGINHPKTVQEYYDKYEKKEGEGVCQNPNCPNENPPTKFQGFNGRGNWRDGYAVGCCLSCAQKAPQTQKKIKQTNIKIYGVDHPNKTEERRKHFSKSNPMKDEFIREKSISTRMEKGDEIQNIREQTNIKKHGFKNPMERPEIKQNHSKLFIERSKDRIIQKLNEVGLDVLEYTKCTSECKLKCKSCGFEFSLKPSWILFNNRRPCQNCMKSLYGNTQKEIYNFCKTFFDNVIENDRNILEGKEIDILIPSIRIGIEYCGLRWHGEIIGNKNRRYHQNKTITSQNKNISLITIFEDEWIKKNDIVKSILTSKFGKLENKIYARKCVIDELSTSDVKIFMNENHIQGFRGGQYYLALRHNDKVVCSLTIGRSRFNKNYEFEIIRFCNEKYSYVIGGLSRLLKYFINNIEPSSIITYADARYSTGSGYLNSGFKYIKLTDPNYFYISDKYRESRIKYQKHKLPNLLELYDPNITEWENMKMNGYDRIWDCGNYVYEWKR